MRTLPPSPLARCPVDGVPLLFVIFGGVVLAGCELCDRVVFYAPRETLEPAQRTEQPPAPPTSAVAPLVSYVEAVRAYAIRASHEVP